MNLRTFCVIMMGIAVFHIGCDRHIDSDSDRLKFSTGLVRRLMSQLRKATSNLWTLTAWRCSPTVVTPSIIQ